MLNHDPEYQIFVSKRNRKEMQIKKILNKSISTLVKTCRQTNNYKILIQMYECVKPDE